MQAFEYRDGHLTAEGVNLTSVAERYGTPCYVYSKAALQTQWRAFDQAFNAHPHLVCYAVKANSNLAVLNQLAQLGSGFDIVSLGELERVLAAHGDAGRIVFSGVGKREDEMRRALQTGIRCFNIESANELETLNQVAAQLGTLAPIAIRVNPDVNAATHPYIATGLMGNKFGVDIDAAAELYQLADDRQHLRITGIACHIGSQLTDSGPFIDALQKVLHLAEHLRQLNIDIQHLDIGGGLGIRYQDEQPPSPAELIDEILRCCEECSFELLVEPGRSIVGQAGVLLTRVLYVKHTRAKNFVVVDAAMNDILRPALYDAWQEILPLRATSQGNANLYDVVGPVCETADFLGKDRHLSVKQHDLLAVRSAGAYGFSMSSNYNSRPRAMELMVDGEEVYVVRDREEIRDLYGTEHLLPTE